MRSPFKKKGDSKDKMVQLADQAYLSKLGCFLNVNCKAEVLKWCNLFSYMCFIKSFKVNRQNGSTRGSSISQ